MKMEIKKLGSNAYIRQNRVQNKAITRDEKDLAIPLLYIFLQKPKTLS